MVPDSGNPVVGRSNPALDPSDDPVDTSDNTVDETFDSTDNAVDTTLDSSHDSIDEAFDPTDNTIHSALDAADDTLDPAFDAALDPPLDRRPQPGLFRPAAGQQPRPDDEQASDTQLPVGAALTIFRRRATALTVRNDSGV